MELIKYATDWSKGEVFQGKVMIAIGILVLVAAIGIFKADNPILKGALIPTGLIVAALLSYGGFQVFSLSKTPQRIQEVMNESVEEAVQQEYAKAQKHSKTYTTAKKVWVGLIILCGVLFLVFSSPYVKGLTVGFIGLFFTILLLDITLHHRLEKYKALLEQLI